MSVAAEFLGADDYSTRTPFAREPGGLVSLDEYMPYLVDKPGDVPIRPNTRHTHPNRFVHQHEYFTAPVYLHQNTARSKRDRRLILLRNSPYSQIIMRNTQEKRMHLDKESIVEPPPKKSRGSIMCDFFDLDIVGATTIGIQESIRPLTLPLWEVQNYDVPMEIRALSSKDKITMLATEREKAIERLASPRILPAQVVASALKRMANYLKDPMLERIANEHLNGDKFYYPLAVQKAGYLRSLGNMVLSNSTGIRSLESSRIMVQELNPMKELQQVA